MSRLLLLIEWVVRYERDMRAWENTWWSREDYVLWCLRHSDEVR